MSDLKPPLQGYSIWFEAKEDDQQFLQSLMDDLAREYGTRAFTAHATLIGLLEKKPSDLSVIKQACLELAGSYRDITTEIIGIGMRNAHLQSVFLPVAPNDDLVAINQEIGALLGHEADPPYMPHWSAVYGDLDTSAKHAIVQKLLKRITFPKTVAITAITLVDVSGYPNEWKIVERYLLN